MQLPLARKVWLCLVGTVFLAALCSALVMLWAIHTSKEVERLLYENLQQATQINRLRVTLLEEERYALLGLLDGSVSRLDKFNDKKSRFDEVLISVKEMEWEPDQRAFVNAIGSAYDELKREQESLLSLCRSGSWDEARRRYDQHVAPAVQIAYSLCERLDAANDIDIATYISQRSVKTERVSLWMVVSLFLSAGLVSGLLIFFIQGLLKPLKQITDEAARYSAPFAPEPARSELDMLSCYLETLKDDALKARSGLAQSHARLMDAEKLATVARLAAGVAHEVRSPLTSLKLRLFSMQKTMGESARSQHDVRVMMEEVNRLDSIVQNFLDFSRPPEIQVGRYSASLLLDSAVELLRYKIDAANVLLECEAPSGLPSVLADANQIKAVFIHLLNNALDSMPCGGKIQLTISSAKGVGEPSMIVVRFRDNGTGILDDIQSEIFSPFFSTKKEGTVLGLWVAKQIMVHHGGLLELEESTSRGSVFAVWIPTISEKNT